MTMERNKPYVSLFQWTLDHPPDASEPWPPTPKEVALKLAANKRTRKKRAQRKRKKEREKLMRLTWNPFKALGS